MKMLDYLLAPVALAGLVATGWWGLYQSPQRPANLAAQLEQDANAALARNGYDWAHVRMNGQRAVLKGAAPSEDAAMAAAEERARDAPRFFVTCRHSSLAMVAPLMPKIAR